MERVKCTLQYDGTLFHGFQRQPNKRTVQGELEKVLKVIHKGQSISIAASGRTDAGVHARGQVIHFDSDLGIPERGWLHALNTQLPDDIRVRSVEKVTEAFHARYSVIEKEYHYFVLNCQEADVFKRHYSYHFPYELNMEKIEEACRYLEGTHDFTTFSSTKSTVKGSKVRTIYEASVKKEASEIEFIFRGSGFLYNMVRIMVSVLLDIGQGRRQPEDIQYLLERNDRKLVGKTIDAHGLHLWNVIYKEME
ncbi:tRNA pseudouridine(38-40) synthase TruA [Oceanobacillus bengalensis]|uniref:tRNA pseudouridine synthase A n=1 Tax=Oceanobacillus bengalensis TaxID=1435466 RepID=A0A494YVK9_9BACI|nr:tRNA pseudouridine(38-40) synthase TruA [Oceanobacillus bengalensis]RKQ14236.1 tRNA pseudouridine(38-40) synthase TruA [Oceanobacillus bengalensis]